MSTLELKLELMAQAGKASDANCVYTLEYANHGSKRDSKASLREPVLGEYGRVEYGATDASRQ